MKWSRCFHSVALLLAILLWTASAAAQHYVAWPDVERLDYAARERLSEQVAAAILPGVLRAIGVPESQVRTEIVPGGYKLKTDPSFVTRFRPDRQDQALLFAAAIGYVLRQDSVLIFAVDEGRGDSLTVRVRLREACLMPSTAHRFFLRAAEVAQGLGGGYTAFGCEMLFINLRDAHGMAYSGMDDGRFEQALRRAAADFTPLAEIVGHFRTQTILVGSDWPASGGGRLYLEKMSTVPTEAMSELDLLSYRFADMLRQIVR